MTLHGVEPHTIFKHRLASHQYEYESLIGIAGGARQRWSGPLAGAGPGRTS